jgi:phage gpG-like protein
MPAQIKIELTKEAQETMRVVRTLPENILRGIAAAMDLENQNTIAHAVQKYLNFPQHEPPVAIGLRHITGRLIRSVNASKATVVGQRVQSAIGSNVVYAAVQEFGYEGEQHIPAHKRRVKSRDTYTVAEVGIPSRARRKLVRGFGYVKAYTRNVNIPARAPIQHAIEDRLDDYSAAISAEVAKAWGGGA